MASSVRPLVVGLGGATCSGKTTLAKMLAEKIFSHCSVLHQDDFYLEESCEKHVPVEGMGHMNWELVTAFDMVKMRNSAEKFVTDKGATFSRAVLSEIQSRVQGLPTSPAIVDIEKAVVDYCRPILLLEGITVLNDPQTATMCDVKLFIELDREEMLRRRRGRSYDPPDPPEYAEKVVWPYYEKNLAEIKRTWNDVVYLDGKSSLEALLKLTVLEIVGCS